ncbi:MAG: histidine phosphatase family protein [Candidatus Levyibacteriota bacterium]
MKNNVTTFYIVRHGETDWNIEKKIQGQTDIPLNKSGEIQASEIAKKFKNIKFDLAFSSDLLRAKRTADIILLEKKLLVETTTTLRERKFGAIEGKPSKIFFEYLEELKAKSHAERLNHRLREDFENDEEIASRVITFLRETAIANPGKIVLITTHGGVFHTILVHLGFMSYEESDKLKIKNTAYLKLLSDGIEFWLKEQEGIIDSKLWISNI